MLQDLLLSLLQAPTAGNVTGTCYCLLQAPITANVTGPVTVSVTGTHCWQCYRYLLLSLLQAPTAGNVTGTCYCLCYRHPLLAMLQVPVTVYYRHPLLPMLPAPVTVSGSGTHYSNVTGCYSALYCLLLPLLQAPVSDLLRTTVTASVTTSRYMHLYDGDLLPPLLLSPLTYSVPNTLYRLPPVSSFPSAHTTRLTPK